MKESSPLIAALRTTLHFPSLPPSRFPLMLIPSHVLTTLATSSRLPLTCGKVHNPFCIHYGLEATHLLSSCNIQMVTSSLKGFQESCKDSIRSPYLPDTQILQPRGDGGENEVQWRGPTWSRHHLHRCPLRLLPGWG